MPSSSRSVERWLLAAVVASTFCMIFGWNWDISWHRSIGRDQVWTWPHVAIYVALAIAFACNAWLVLRGTFGVGKAEPGIRVLGFHGPAGAFVTLWAVLLQFTAILFDNWWHGVFGLDNSVFSPPHYMLAGAIAVFYFGQFMLATSLRNRGLGGTERATRWVLLVVWSFFLGHLLILDPQNGPLAILSRTFLITGAVVVPFALLLIDALLDSRWAAVISSALYMLAIIALMQLFQLFPAQPLFGPVFHRVTHLLPPAFPLLLVVPAFATSFALRAFRSLPRPLAYGATGATFVVAFLGTNTAMGALLTSPIGANRFFAGNFPGTAFLPGYLRFSLLGFDAGSAVRVAIATIIASSSCFTGAATGRWLRTVVR